MRFLLAALFGLAVFAVIVVGVRAKARYDDLRGEAYAVALIDQTMATFLADVERTWVPKMTEKNGAEADVVRAAGKTPSVQNFIRVVDYQMPPFRWWAPSANRKAVELAMFKALRPPALDKRWHMTEDRRLAFLRSRENIVLVYRDEGDGLRMTVYAKESSEQPAIRP